MNASLIKLQSTTYFFLNDNIKPGRRASFFNLKAAYQGLVNSPNYQHHTWKIRCIPIISKQHINLGEIHILINGGQSLESYKSINLKLVENNYA